MKVLRPFLVQKARRAAAMRVARRIDEVNKMWQKAWYQCRSYGLQPGAFGRYAPKPFGQGAYPPPSLPPKPADVDVGVAHPSARLEVPLEPCGKSAVGLEVSHEARLESPPPPPSTLLPPPETLADHLSTPLHELYPDLHAVKQSERVWRYDAENGVWTLFSDLTMTCAIKSDPLSRCSAAWDESQRRRDPYTVARELENATYDRPWTPELMRGLPAELRTQIVCALTRREHRIIAQSKEWHEFLLNSGFEVYGPLLDSILVEKRDRRVKEEEIPDIRTPVTPVSIPEVEDLREFFETHRSDPFHPPPFRVHAETYNELLKEVQAKYSVGEEYGEELAKCRDHLSHCYRIFVAMLFATKLTPREHMKLKAKLPTAVFDKREMDDALEAAIGSKRRRATGKYAVPSLGLVLDFRKYKSECFSLYMCRKAYTIPDPSAADERTADFLKTATTPAPPHPKRLRMRGLFKKIFGDMVSRLPKSATKLPNSGKGCTEFSRKEGGKRNVLTTQSSDHPDRSIPTTIFTGGKLRTITLTSIQAERYAWLNQEMGRIVRLLPQAIFGRSVEEWIGDLNVVPQDDAYWVSGDLKSATDLFDNCFGDDAIDLIVDAGIMPSVDREEMRREMRGFFTHAEYWSKDRVFGVWLDHLGTQVRGQSMASDFSFPILCVMSICICIETIGLTGLFIDADDQPITQPVKKDGKWVAGDSVDVLIQDRRLRRFGFNGDDVAIHVQGRSGAKRWGDAVVATGGEPVYAKSPLSREYVTVNSELWEYSSIKGFTQVPLVLPAMLLHLQTEAHKVPDRKWFSLFTDRVISRTFLTHHLAMDQVLMPEMPRSWGGLGLYCTDNFDGRFFARVAWLRAARQKDEGSLTRYEEEMGAAIEGVPLRIGRTDVTLFPGLEEESEELSEGWVSKAFAGWYAQHRFGLKDGVRWARGKTGSRSAASARHDARKIKRYCGLSGIRWDYCETHDYESHGYVWARVPKKYNPRKGYATRGFHALERKVSTFVREKPESSELKEIIKQTTVGARELRIAALVRDWRWGHLAEGKGLERRVRT
jgi:hypothetical protein